MTIFHFNRLIAFCSIFLASCSGSEDDEMARMADETVERIETELQREQTEAFLNHLDTAPKITIDTNHLSDQTNFMAQQEHNRAKSLNRLND